MKRAQYAQRGPVPQEFIEAVDFTLPPPAAGQALIAMCAASSMAVRDFASGL